MLSTRLLGLILVYGLCPLVEAQTAGQTTPQPALAGTSAASGTNGAAGSGGTLVLKIEQTGTVSIDGKEPVKAQAGQVMNFPLQTGRHLVTLQPKDGKPIDKQVQVKASESVVETLGGSSLGSSLLHLKLGKSSKSDSRNASQADSHPAVDMERAELRVAALHLLGLYTAEIAEAKKYRIASADPTTEESLKKIQELPGKEASTISLLALGNPDRALAKSEEDLKTWGRFDPVPPDFTLELDLKMRALARFAAGGQQQGIADLSELQRVLTLTPPLPDSEGDKSAATLQVPLALSAMNAIVGDWKGCAESLPETTKGALGKDAALRELVSGCKALAASTPLESVHVALAATTTSSAASETAAKPFVYPVEQHLRLVAWEALGLDTDAAKEADSVGMEAGRSALIEKRITDAEARKAKLEAGSHPVPASLLLELGQRQQALRVADTDLHEQQDLLQKALAAKAKCKTCTSLADPFVTSAAQARLTRATALYANGRQEEAIAEIQAQIKAEGQNRALVQTQEALKSVSPAKPAKYETDQAYNMLAAIKALAGDWDGCLKALGELSDEDFNSPRHQSVIWKGCRWMKATDPGSADKPPASNQLSAIRGEIETVVRSGKYRSLPEPRVIADSTASGPASITIKNSSRYNLTVLCAGPAECSTQVAAGQTAEVRLPAGSYQMLGRVDMPSAQPLYEQYAFESGFVYNFDFSMAMQ